jgi:hypothetical protein
MINNCTCCNKTPKLRTLVSCDNNKCPEFDVEYFVWDWQALVKPGEGEVFIESPC